MRQSIMRQSTTKFLLYLGFPVALAAILLSACAEQRVGEAAQALQTVPGTAVSPASGYMPDGSATSYMRSDNQQIVFWGGPWDVPVPNVSGAIAGFGAVVTDNAGSTGNHIKVELMSTLGGVIGTLTSSGAGGEHGLTSLFATPYTLISGELVWLRFSPLTPSGGWATMSSTIESASVTLASAQSSFNLTVSGYATRASTVGTPGFGDVLYSNEPAIAYPITGVSVGQVITEVDAQIVDSPGTVYEIRFSDGIQSLVIGPGSAGDGSQQTLHLSGLSYHVVPLASMVILLQRKAGTGTLVVQGANVIGHP